MICVRSFTLARLGSPEPGSEELSRCAGPLLRRMVGVEVADEVARHRRVARRHRPTPQEDAMSATTIPASRAPALGHGLRIALVAAAIVVLLALSFVAGRATDTAAGSAPPVTPVTTAP